MQGILPDASDWQTKLNDGRILAIGYFSYGEDANLNCVLQKDANNGADSHVDFELIHEWSDITARLNSMGVDNALQTFVDEANVKLASKLNGNVPQIPTEAFARLSWHFRFSMAFNKTTNKIVFTKP